MAFERNDREEEEGSSIEDDSRMQISTGSHVQGIKGIRKPVPLLSGYRLSAK
ncbi:hypothetical protein WN51_01494 [Melipona quadrifasciata]|uniref:Uncharacterized protein n=1 Tax=Melipona quadrifasciata TaxID=166423 RepID=A0A0M8ZW90_9HYME|nr:hypothetical protein WN51_01494 [Melipona quadrifasciata]